MSPHEFDEIERPQSHSYILFPQGAPYVELGWAAYRELKATVDSILFSLEVSYGISIYQHEHEFLDYEDTFIWWFSFVEENDCKRNEISEVLKSNLEEVFFKYEAMRDKQVLNHKDDDFHIDPHFTHYYCELVVGAKFELKHIQAPIEKTHKKPDLDLAPFEKTITVRDFKELINFYVSPSSLENLEYFRSPNGFHSSRRSAGSKAPHKFLREELLPSLRYIRHRKVCDSASLKFGLETDNFDLKITEGPEDLILEITWAVPQGDFELLSLSEQRGLGNFPMKTLAKLKLMFDSIPNKIIKAIDDKHAKNYQDKRSLLVVTPVDYTYQGEVKYIEEMLSEVRSHTGKGNFDEILLLCGKKIFSIFGSK
ncbi:hypothetical protein [Pseudomonas syringae]|uniref:hypothetical protein n=1 Tax=Pseudomonas syringae TaxID=317 RepID=UPI003F7517E3